MNDFELKRQQKIDRARELARKADQESTARYNSAQQTASFIPMGQPILVGHHSEARHRRDLDRIDNNMRASIEAGKKAQYYREKADRLENSTVISSDDPEALDKLKAKLAALEQAQELMKQANKIIRSKLYDAEKIHRLTGMGFTAEKAAKLLEPDWLKRTGFPTYKLSNNNQNMATIKKRIEQLQRRATQQTSEVELNGVRIVDNVEENRLQAFFDGKPSDEVREKLKRAGFRWAPSNECWQAYRNRWAQERLVEICNNLKN